MSSVPDTHTFTLKDVAFTVFGVGTLIASFAAAVDAQFDPAYKGSKDRLSNFRNYDTARGVFTITTIRVFDISRTSFSIDCVISNGTSETISNRGIVIATHATPTISDLVKSYALWPDIYTVPVVSQGSPANAIIYPNTTYYVRSYCEVGGASRYGNEISFTTLP